MMQSADIFVDIVVLLLILEILGTIIFILFIYCLKIYKNITKGSRERIEEDVEKIILFRIEDRTPLSQRDMHILNKDVLITLKVAEYFDHKNQPLSYWKLLRKQLIEHVFEKKNKNLYKSGNQLKRYFAAKMFLFHFNTIDTDKVIKLIKDPALFISTTGAKVGFKFSSAILINESIDVFYLFRRLQKSVLSSIAAGSPESSKNIVIERLFREEDPYMRCFCYSIMMQFSPDETLSDKFTRYVKTITTHVLPPFHIIQHLSEALPRDLNSNVLDLRIAALSYAGQNPGYYYMVPHYLTAPEWQLRALAAKMAGKNRDESAAETLGVLLSDKEWWVRIRAAQSLALLGEKGIRILKAQSMEKDKYAYEAACQALLDFHKDQR